MVEVSPSTEIILNVSFTSALTARCSSSLDMAASVVTKASMVHILGWIMPEPLHMPPMVTVFPPSSTWTAISLCTVSVVIMAFAAAVPFSAPAPFASFKSEMPFFSRSMGSCMPMTPVDATSTAFSGTPKTFAASFAVSSQYP